MTTGVYDFLLKTQLLLGGYIYNFQLILSFGCWTISGTYEKAN